MAAVYENKDEALSRIVTLLTVMYQREQIKSMLSNRDIERILSLISPDINHVIKVSE